MKELHFSAVASRVQTALGLAFMDAARRDLFMNKLGLSILEVSLHKLEFNAQPCAASQRSGLSSPHTRQSHCDSGGNLH